MISILQLIPAYAKRSPNGWYSFNAPCCVHNGETADKRKRGGIKIDGNDWGYHCFNCNFSTKHEYGHPLTEKAINLLIWLGVDQDTIRKINLDNLKNRTMDVYRLNNDEISPIESFKRFELPDDARLITEDDTKFVDYLHSRGLNLSDYPFYITPNGVGRNKNRILIPYFYARQIVGWTSRFLDYNKLRYLNEHQQPGYIFGLDMQDTTWPRIIVAEGILDAISVRGASVMHNEFSKTQVAMLKRLGKEVIVVPDQDNPGLVLAYEAIEHGFSVSTPDWGENADGNNIKDINEAVQQFGKVGTLLSIIYAKESNKVKITMALNNMKRRAGIK